MHKIKGDRKNRYMNYSIKHKRIMSIIGAVLISFVVFATTLFSQAVPTFAAETAAYELTKYDVLIDVNKDHSYDVTQKITVNLIEDESSLEFILPTGRFKLSNITTSANSSVNLRGEDNSVTIIDKKKLTRGTHTYVINYKVSEYQDRESANDVFYYNALLPEWRVPIGELSIIVDFPEDFDMEALQVYSGQFGIDETTSKLTASVSPDKNELTITASKIPQNYAVTLKAELPDGYWKGAIDHTQAAYMMLGLLLLATLISLVLWVIGGRDPRVPKTRYDHPVPGLTPAEISYAFEGKLKYKDYTILIIYLATKGYLKIQEYSPKKYRLYKVSEPKGEVRYIRNVFNAIFDDVYEGRPVELEDVWSSIRQIHASTELDVAAGFADKSMASCTSLAKALRFISILVISAATAAIPILANVYQYVDITYTGAIVAFGLSIIALLNLCHRFERKYEISTNSFVLAMLGSFALYLMVVFVNLNYFVSLTNEYAIALAAFLVAILAAIVCINITARGIGNAELTSKLISIKKWIYSAKKEDVAPILKDDPDYYYNMLPYAVSFDALITWAKTFETLRIAAPDWYSDETEGHAAANIGSGSENTVAYARDIKIFERVMKDVYRTVNKRYYK